jgi:aldehyde dehydrogenase (NAD+)
MTIHTPAPASDTAVVARLRAGFDGGRTRSLDWRRAQLQGLRRMLKTDEAAIVKALHADLRKHPSETWATEIASVLDEIKLALRHLGRWSARRRVRTSILAMPGRSWLMPEPLGVVLNIAAWNYPIQEGLTPMVGALAAGNCVVLKPSELAPASAAMLADLLPRYLDPDCVAVVQGGPQETGALLEQRFDHILYTGSGKVGRIVAQAAARHLTPVTLELGGKSPVIVDASANIDLTARRIAWGKWQNAGQICIAPDYVLAHDSIRDQLIAALQAEVTRMFGTDPQASDSYGRIVNARHFDRLAGYLGDGTLAFGGQTDRDDLYIAPALLTGVPGDAPVMTDEIFGPILPVLGWSTPDQVTDFVTNRDKPLALYLFSNDAGFTDAMLDAISAGNVCINDVLMFMVCPNLPFGGVGASGTGSYSGKAGFDTFTHWKPVLKRGWAFDFAARYPPYTPAKNRLMRWLRG